MTSPEHHHRCRRPLRGLALAVTAGLCVSSVTTASGDSVLQQLVVFDDPSSKDVQMEDAYQKLTLLAQSQPIVCVELLRRLWRGHPFDARLQSMFRDIDTICGAQLPELLMVLRGTGDDLPGHYGLLSETQLKSNSALVKEVIINGEKNQAEVLVQMSCLMGLDEFADAIAEGVLNRRWSPYEMITREPFGGSTRWENWWGLALVRLQEYEHPEQRRRALEVVRTSLLNDGDLEDNLSARRLLDDITAELNRMRSLGRESRPNAPH